jgi:hypothetical protein
LVASTAFSCKNSLNSNSDSIHLTSWYRHNKHIAMFYDFLCRFSVVVFWQYMAI